LKHSVSPVLAALISLLVILPALPIGGAPAPGAPAPPSGRAEGDPPTNGTEWDIVRDYTISGSTRNFAGNITVFTGVTLNIRNLGRLVVPPRAEGHWTMFVKAGGNVEIADGSELLVDHYIAESGTGLTVLNNSIVTANGVFNATSSVTFTDSTLTVVAPSGREPSDPGEPAKLHLDSGTGGNIQRAVLSVTGGNGRDGKAGDGLEGGWGGPVSVVVTSKDFSGMRLTAQAGHGGKGGSAGLTSANAGKGGRGGSLSISVGGNSFENSSILGASGNGGTGQGGASPPGQDAGYGGDGGEGGSVQFKWAGRGLSVSQNSNITVTSGHGGEGGAGGQAVSAGKTGGNGGRGGNGGTILVNLTSNGTLDMTDSVINFRAGYGPAGGVFGRAMPGGKDGSAGDGGDGGSCALQAALNDAFTATNATLLSEAGDGGAGGLGSTGGKGGTGGTSLLNLSLTTVLYENTVTVRNGALVSRGGAGGAGGKGLSAGQSQGQPGDGGKGGGAKLFIWADKSVHFNNSWLLCDEGLSGPADPPARSGNPGVGELYMYTSRVTMARTVYSQTMAWVDGNDLWTLDSSPLVRTNPPARPPHFLPRLESGVAEEYWILTANVQDIRGAPITDGTVTVEVYFGEQMVASKLADSFGRAVFRLIGSRFTTDPATEFHGRVYTVRAVKNTGEFAYSVSAQMVQDLNVTLTIITKPYAPICNISSPDERIQPYIDALQYTRSEGRTEMFIIEGSAQDHQDNAMPVISKVEVKIGEDGAWTPANFEMTVLNFYKWNLTWDIYNWSVSKLAVFPSGIIPAPVYARAYNDMFWSDNTAFGGGVCVSNITVRLLKIPPKPPEVQITRPVPSPANGTINIYNASFEKLINFDGVVIKTYGTKVIRYEWCFDATGGYRPDFSSPVSPATNASYPIYRNDERVDVILKVFDNESARRVELYRAGVSYDEFKYEFDPNDGSVMVKLRVYIKPVKTPEVNIFDQYWKNYGFITILGIVSLLMMIGAVQTYRVRRRTIAERKAKLERESLRIDVSEMKCARCNEPIADPSAGCLQCKAQDELGRTQQRLLDLKGSGVNVTEAESLLEVGVDAFDAKSYTEAYEKASAAKAKATELEERYQKTAKVISGWETRIAAMRVDRPEADMSEAETKVYHSRLALGRGDHDEAVKNLDGLEGVLAKADKVGVKKGAEELLESTRRMLANIEKRGVIGDQRIKTAIAEAETALERGTYELVTSRCREAETLVKETNKSFMRASESLRQSESRILNAKGMGQGVGGTEEWLAQARTAMAGGNYQNVIDLTGRVLGFFGVAPKPFAATKKVDWKREVAVLEGAEGKPAAPRPAPAATAPAVTTLEVEPSPELKEAAERLIKEAYEAVARAREAAADVTDGEGLLEKARDAYKARRYEESQDLAKSAKFLLAELAAAAPHARPGAPAAPAPRPAAPAVPTRPAAVSGAAAELKALLDRADGLLKALGDAGGDITGPEDKLKRAKAARDGGSPAVAMQYANESITETELLMKEYTDAKNAMETVQKDLAAAKSRGLDVSDAEFQLKQARAAMSGGAFTRAADTAKLVDGMLRELEPAGAPQKPLAPPQPAAAEAPAKPASAKCPSCGRDAKPHWKTCPFCGASMSAEKPAAAAPKPPAAPAPAAPDAPQAPAAAAAPAAEPAPAAPRPPAVAPAPPAPAAEAAPKTAACPKCGAALKPHWKVCPSCGGDVSGAAPAAPAAPVALKCPACGSKIEPSWTSCPICLTALVPEKGFTPEAPKKVIKVAKKPGPEGDGKPAAPTEGDEKKPVLKVVKKTVLAPKEEEKK
jgi:hypothetical protein